jgi:hypothetical protein
MHILGTVSSGYFVIPEYTLSQTFNTSGTYTVPSGKSYIAVYVVGGGGGGQSGTTQTAGGGGGGGGVASFAGYAVVPGQQFSVTVGSGGSGGVTGNQNSGGGGTSSFGNLATANGGTARNSNAYGNQGDSASFGGSGEIKEILQVSAAQAALT